MKPEIRKFIVDALRSEAADMRVTEARDREYDDHRARESGPEILAAFADDIAELDALAADPPPPFTPEELEAVAEIVMLSYDVVLAAGRWHPVRLLDGGDGWVVVKCLTADVGAVTQGRTREEALANAVEAIEVSACGDRTGFSPPNDTPMFRVAAALSHLQARNEGAWDRICREDKERLYRAMNLAGIPCADDKDNVLQAVAELDAGAECER